MCCSKSADYLIQFLFFCEIFNISSTKYIDSNEFYGLPVPSPFDDVRIFDMALQARLKARARDERELVLELVAILLL